MTQARRRQTATRKEIDTLSELVRAFRTIQIAQGNHPWLLLDMTMAQLKAVMLLAQSGGLRSREFADGLGIGPSAATPLVDRLVAQKLVQREPDADDRRIIWIRPTPKAIQLYDELMQHTNRPVLVEVLEELPTGSRQTVYDSMVVLLEAATRVLERRKQGGRVQKQKGRT